MSPSVILILPSFQAQESPDNSLFSFQIGAISQEEGEEATSAGSATLSDEINTFLAGRAFYKKRGQTLGISSFSELRHWPIDQECPADPCHPRRTGGHAPKNN